MNFPSCFVMRLIRSGVHTFWIGYAIGMASSGFAQDAIGPKLRSAPFALTESDRSWWAFQPIERPAIPQHQTPTLPSSAIDAFVSSRLEREGIIENPEAPRRHLIRRAYFDVIGLPPTPDAVERFLKDASLNAWDRVVDELLASPHFGERWGRHWLDLVRYAESNGYERDGPKPHAWRYRDYASRPSRHRFAHHG